jgi:NAD-dependent deacetylase
MSAESGIATFRGAGGLWEGHRIEDVATPQAWRRNPELVLEFYNQRRRNVIESAPNAGHLALAKLQGDFDIVVITQNVDDLHERAGSEKILHLHGEIRKARSSKNPDLVYAIEGSELNKGDVCELGSQLRPHIVWFGEDVPHISFAAEIVAGCEALIVVGTSLAVYPAAGLIYEIRPGVPVWAIDPHVNEINLPPYVRPLQATASKGMVQVTDELKTCFRDRL